MLATIICPVAVTFSDVCSGQFPLGRLQQCFKQNHFICSPSAFSFLVLFCLKGSMTAPQKSYLNVLLRGFDTVRDTVLCLSLMLAVLSYGCSAKQLVRQMNTTAYCGCGHCCGWERGSRKYLNLNFWNRYINVGKRKGQIYTGLTANGKKPHEPRSGLFSMDSIKHPWMIPVRIVFFPWLLTSRDGTIAADTRFYPFGTRVYVPGYGWGVVDDRGGAIKGSNRLDLYFNSHKKALAWGRKTVKVRIEN